MNTTNDLRGLRRGKRVNNGTWVVGYYVKYPVCDNETLHLIIGLDGQYNKVDPLTLGECTGLCDKKGSPIFEGDIVRYGDTIHEVVFETRNSTAYFGLVYSPVETLPFGYYQDLRQIEVIGNIYDNPEMLKDVSESDTKGGGANG